MISFTIPGTPVPQGRPRFNSITKRTYYDDKTTEYRERVKAYAILAQNGNEPLSGALAMIVDCMFPIPASWPKYRKQAALQGQWHTDKGDIDNCIKAVADSLNGVVYDDDKQIAVLVGFKHYSLEPETRVSVFELNHIENPRWLIANIKRAVEAGTL